MKRRSRCPHCLAVGLILSTLIHAIGLVLWLHAPEAREPPWEREITLDLGFFVPEPASAGARTESSIAATNGANAGSITADDSPPTDLLEPLQHLARAESDQTTGPELVPEPASPPASDPVPELVPELNSEPAAEPEPEPAPKPAAKPQRAPHPVPSQSVPRQRRSLPPAPQIRPMAEIKAAREAARSKRAAKANRTERLRTREVRQLAADHERSREQAKREAAEEARRIELARQEVGETLLRKLAERKAAEESRRRERAERKAAEATRQNELARREAAEAARQKKLARRKAAEEARQNELARRKATEAARQKKLARREAAEEASRRTAERADRLRRIASTKSRATANAGRSSSGSDRGSAGSTSQQAQGHPSTSGEAAVRAYLAELKRAIQRHQRFPDDARLRRSTGTTTLAFVIHADGRIREARLAKSSGDASLDQAALAALQRLDRFKPIPAAIDRSRWNLKVPIHFDLK